ncbi:hypothetical protein MAJ_11272, partial [Metarhizium majus ARSEF 297]
MARGERSQVFWLEYRAGKHETFDEVLDFVNEIVPGKPGIWASEEMREVDGEQCRMIHLMICTGKSQRVNTVVGKEKWARKARSRVRYEPRSEVGYVHEWACRKKDERVDDFIDKWGAKLARIPDGKQRGCKEDVRAVLRRQREEERQRGVKRRLGEEGEVRRTRKRTRNKKAMERGAATEAEAEEQSEEVQTGQVGGSESCPGDGGTAGSGGNLVVCVDDMSWEVDMILESFGDERSFTADFSVTWSEGWMDIPRLTDPQEGDTLIWEEDWNNLVEFWP